MWVIISFILFLYFTTGVIINIIDLYEYFTNKDKGV